jgi:hypothetical protein
VAAAGAAKLQLPGTQALAISPAALHSEPGTPNNTASRPAIAAPQQAAGISSGDAHRAADPAVTLPSHKGVGRAGGIGRGGGIGGIGRGAPNSTTGNAFSESTQQHPTLLTQQAPHPIAGDIQPAAPPLSALPAQQRQALGKQQAAERPQVAVNAASHHWNPWDPTTFGQFGRDIEAADANHGLSGSQNRDVTAGGTQQPQLQRATTAGGGRKQQRAAAAAAEPQRPHTASGLLSKFFRCCCIVTLTRAKQSCNSRE